MLQLLQAEAPRMMEVEAGRLSWARGADGAEQADSSQSCPAVARTERAKPQRCWGSSGVALLSFLASRIPAPACQALGRG